MTRIAMMCALALAACATTYDYDPTTVGDTEGGGRAPRGKTSSQFVRGVYADLLGRTPTLADVAVFAQLATLARCREGRFLADAPTVDAWVRRLGAVPPIAAALSP